MSIDVVNLLHLRLEAAHTLLSQSASTVVASTIEDRQYVEYPEGGLSIVASTGGNIVAIQLYAAGYQGYEQFKGAVPDHIAFSESRDSIRKRLGQPVASGGGGQSECFGEIPQWDLFERNNYRLHIQYTHDGAAISLITLQTKSSH